MTLPDLSVLEDIVRTGARRELLPSFGRARFEYKPDGSIVTPADDAMQRFLENELAAQWPDYAFLGEEMPADRQAQAMRHEGGYWCIDPLDGTNNYATGMPFFAVSIGLIIGGRQRLGLIHDPLRDEVFTAVEAAGARLNGDVLHGLRNRTALENTVAEIDMKRLPAKLATRLVTQAPYSSQRNIGSSALDWCWLAAGRYDVYLHGGQKLWDYAAGSLIAREAGGTSVSLDGEPVFRNRLEVRSVLASLDDELFRYWQDWIGIAAR